MGYYTGVWGDGLGDLAGRPVSRGALIGSPPADDTLPVTPVEALTPVEPVVRRTPPADPVVVVSPPVLPVTPIEPAVRYMPPPADPIIVPVIENRAGVNRGAVMASSGRRIGRVVAVPRLEVSSAGGQNAPQIFVADPPLKAPTDPVILQTPTGPVFSVGGQVLGPAPVVKSPVSSPPPLNEPAGMIAPDLMSKPKVTALPTPVAPAPTLGTQLSGGISSFLNDLAGQFGISQTTLIVIVAVGAFLLFSDAPKRRSR